MFKSALIIGLMGASMMTANSAMAHGNSAGIGMNMGSGFISLHVTPSPTIISPPTHHYHATPARRMPPPPPPRPRCVPGNVVDNMQANQASRIQAGRRSGDLTRSEVSALNEQLDRIARAEWQMRKDGCLTLAERNDLVNRLNQAAREITQQINDNQTRRRNSGRHNNRHH